MPHTGTGMSAPPRSRRRPLVVAYHGLWLVAATLTSSVGLVSGLVTLTTLDLTMCVGASALAAAGCYWMLVHGIESRPVRLRRDRLLLATLTGGLGAWVLVGMTALLGPPGCVIVISTIAVSPIALKACATRFLRDGSTSRIRQATAVLDTTVHLRNAWHASSTALAAAATTTDTLKVVVLREELLRELERRDPAAFGRWLTAASGGRDDLDHPLDPRPRTD